jgi:hypothetical protein
MVERSMIEGRTVLVTCVDDELRPVADRREAAFLRMTARFCSTGRAATRCPRGPCERRPRRAPGSNSNGVQADKAESRPIEANPGLGGIGKSLISLVLL